MKKPSLKLTVFKQKIEAETFRNSQNHKKTIEFHIGSQAPKVPPKIAISHVFVISGSKSCRIKPPKNFFLVFLIEFQLYFTGFLKVYVTVILFKKYLTSKIEKNVPFFFFLQFYEPPDLGKKIMTT